MVELMMMSMLHMTRHLVYLNRNQFQKQQISNNAEGGINVVNDHMQHANVNQEINVSSAGNRETCRRKANVGKVKRKIFDS